MIDNVVGNRGRWFVFTLKSKVTSGVCKCNLTVKNSDMYLLLHTY